MAVTLRLLGGRLIETKNVPLALDAFEQALNVSPHHEGINGSFLKALVGTVETDRFLTYYNAVAVKYPDSYIILKSFASGLSLLGMDAEAVEIYEKSLNLPDLSNRKVTMSFFKKDDDLYITYLRLLDYDLLKTDENVIFFELYFDIFGAEETYLPKSFQEFLNPPNGVSQEDIYPMQKFRDRISHNRARATELRDGGYASLAKSVSHYLHQSISNEDDKRINKKI